MRLNVSPNEQVAVDLPVASEATTTTTSSSTTTATAAPAATAAAAAKLSKRMLADEECPVRGNAQRLVYVVRWRIDFICFLDFVDRLSPFAV